MFITVEHWTFTLKLSNLLFLDHTAYYEEYSNDSFKETSSNSLIAIAVSEVSPKC